MSLVNVMDISTYQAGLDLAHAREELQLGGIYVKLGGDNVGRYVAPHYVSQVDAARKAGFPFVGHYWVPGKQDPTAAADYFVSHLRGFSKTTDFAVLDNETLNRGKLYADTDAARFCERVMAKLGIPASQVVVYLGASDLRAARWPRLEKLGVSVLVASYGRNTGKRDHEPVMAGRFGDVWAAHQYTSRGRVSGWGGDLDLNVFQSRFFESWGAKAPSGGSSSTPKPSTPSSSGPSSAQAKSLQKAAKLYGYDGPIDGDLGPNGWEALQKLLDEKAGYTGAQDGEPGKLTYSALQRFAERGGYDGPVDGIPGANTWKGAAKAADELAAASKPKPVTKPEPKPVTKPAASSGDAEKRARKALQTWARRGGYHGPIDGVLGEHSWKGVQLLLSKGYGYSGKVDGIPGTLTYQALQRLAKKGGYTGPVDGELGVHSWTGIAKALGA